MERFFLHLVVIIIVMTRPLTDGDKKPLLNNIVIQNDYPEFPNVSSVQGSSEPGVVVGDDNKYHLDEIIPPKHNNRTIVLCFDGTGDQFDEDVCNHFLFFYHLKRVLTNGPWGTLFFPRIPISFSSSLC